MAEEWREIPNTDYSVSDQGRVASRKFGKWRVMCPGRNRDGYLSVLLFDGHGGYRPARVHTLVAEAFLGPRPTPKHEVNHIDGIKANNHADNFEWVTRSQNMRHARDVLGRKPVHGEANGHAKVTEVEVREILRRRAAGELLRVIAADFGIHLATVGKIVTGRTWAWLA